ncbi:oxidoreductase [Salinibacterium sp. dk2585]|uniref:PDR/VanB family oxidoreductase n=1 Tax=unclassified Salinibacterium TaxID=2632331 RepID=UPI0011C24C4B|nr:MULTISPECIES: PDR/VanB family oxidoreductase [unclassified Salinibacterium]QEE61432.1 oxidoreductase [Salinibacterium sp. dk2585]TXK54109.1 oxidoreductase [Salinibacterium sp. dk5596]
MTIETGPAEASGTTGAIDAIVDRVETVADRVVSLVLRRADGEPFHGWDPGSHIDVHVGDDIVRQYSLCSSPSDLSHLRIAVLYTPDSRGGSRRVHEALVEGAPVTISEPRNNFPLLDSRKYLFIAGGIGITPIIPMIEAAERDGRDWRLIYGGRSRSTMAFARQLVETYGAERLTVAAEDESGRLDLASLLALPRAHMLVYACGPAGMLAAIEEFCMGWPPGALHTERFVAAALDAGGSTEPFEVELVRSGTTVTVEVGTTVLEAVEAVGARVLSSCRTGLCGTCETRVVSGDIEHRDAVLTEADRDAGDVMLVCVSRAAAGCPRLVLDL